MWNKWRFNKFEFIAFIVPCVYLYGGVDAVITVSKYVGGLAIILFLILWMMQDWVLKLKIKLWRYLENER